LVDVPTTRGRPSRRHALGLLAAAGVTGLAGVRPAQALIGHERKLSFFNVRTEEYLETVYWRDGDYRPQSLGQIDWFLRDFRADEVKAIDVRLLDLLHAMKMRLQQSGPFHVISGYRTAATNAMLARRSSRVAKNSYHIKGMAIDLHLPGCPLNQLRDCGLAMKRGGVGAPVVST
jgi:uncharacterized protein YcbK (DUF882 family)